MADELIGRQVGPGHRAVPASRMSENPYLCPHCKSKNVTVVGFFKRSFEQSFVEGQPVENGLSMGGEALQQIDSLVCHGCNVHTYVEEDAEYEREGMIFDLQLQIATLQGKVATGSAKEYKN
jgi:hypothetical protein